MPPLRVHARARGCGCAASRRGVCKELGHARLPRRHAAGALACQASRKSERPHRQERRACKKAHAIRACGWYRSGKGARLVYSGMSATIPNALPLLSLPLVAATGVDAPDGQVAPTTDVDDAPTDISNTSDDDSEPRREMTDKEREWIVNGMQNDRFKAPGGEAFNLIRGGDVFPGDVEGQEGEVITLETIYTRMLDSGYYNKEPNSASELYLKVYKSLAPFEDGTVHGRGYDEYLEHGPEKESRKRLRGFIDELWTLIDEPDRQAYIKSLDSTQCEFELDPDGE